MRLKTNINGKGGRMINDRKKSPRLLDFENEIRENGTGAEIKENKGGRMKLPDNSIQLNITEQTQGVPENVKVNIEARGYDETEAVKNALKDIHHTIRAYRFSEIEDKAIEAIEKNEYPKAEGLVKALASCSSHTNTLIFNAAMQFVVAGKATEILPMLLNKLKGQWTNGTQRTFHVDLKTLTVVPSPEAFAQQKDEAVIDVKAEG